MKTKEELNALNEKADTLNTELHVLGDEHLGIVAGGLKIEIDDGGSDTDWHTETGDQFRSWWGGNP